MFGENFISYVQLLYSEVFVIVKAGGGLSAPTPVLKGIRQGCPLSGQLYSLVIEPLLSRLKKNLKGIPFPDVIIIEYRLKLMLMMLLFLFQIVIRLIF